MWDLYLLYPIFINSCSFQNSYDTNTTEFLKEIQLKGIVMKGMNIVRLDSKGRVLIPSHIRKDIGMIENSEIIVVKDQDELKLFPLYKGMNAKIKLLLRDVPGALAIVTNIIAKHDCNIIVSHSVPMEKDLAEWSAVLQAKNTELLPKLKKVLSESNVVERVKLFY